MLAYYYSARPRAVFWAAISVGLFAVSGASLRAAEKPPVNTVVTTITGFNSPNGIIVSPDGKSVYVANTGNNTVSVVDTKTNEITATLADPQNQPLDLAITSNGQKLFASNQGYTGDEYNAASIAIFDTKTSVGTTDSTNGSFPCSLALTPDEKHLWVPEVGGNKIDILNVASGKLSPYPISSVAPRTILFLPDGKTAYVVNIYGFIWVTEVATGKHTATITIGNSPWGICLSPNGKKAYVLNMGSFSAEGYFSPTISVIDTASNAVTDTVNLPAITNVTTAGSKMALTPDGKYLYVPIQDQYTTTPSSVLTVSTETNSVVGDPVTLAPGSIYAVAISPNGQNAYVTNVSASTVTVIKINE